MTNNEAITTLKANYPDSCYEQLREAVDAAIKALEAQEKAQEVSNNSPELDKGNGELSGLYDMLLPESPYVFYDNDRGCCINTADVLTLITQLSVTGHWIPCSERLPDNKGYVLVTDYGETNIGRRFCGKWWLDYCGDKMKDVTAWMPLPEPYKEGE